MQHVIKHTLFLMALLLVLPSASAETKISNASARQIAKAYGFYLGQDLSLQEIKREYPSLARMAYFAEHEFSEEFLSSLENMDKLMEERIGARWSETKPQIMATLNESYDIDAVSKEDASDFIAQVRQRAKGEMESPFLETFLAFKPEYMKNPERELLEGYTNRYSSNGSGKAKGVPFSIQYPKTWIAKSGNRPNIVQKFTSESGQGKETLMVQVRNIPLGPLPGFWVREKVSLARMSNTIVTEIVRYVLFHGSKMIQIEGHAVVSINGKSTQ